MSQRLNPDRLPPPGDPEAVAVLQKAWTDSKRRGRAGIEALTFLTHPDTPPRVMREAWTIAPHAIRSAAARNPNLPPEILTLIPKGQKIRDATSLVEISNLTGIHPVNLVRYLTDLRGLFSLTESSAFLVEELSQRCFGSAFRDGLPESLGEALRLSLNGVLEHPDCPESLHLRYLEKRADLVLSHCQPQTLQLALDKMRSGDHFGTWLLTLVEKEYAVRGEDPQELNHLYAKGYARTLSNPHIPQETLTKALRDQKSLSWALRNPKLDFSQVRPSQVLNWSDSLLSNPETPEWILSTLFQLSLSFKSPKRQSAMSKVLRHPNLSPKMFNLISETIDDPDIDAFVQAQSEWSQQLYEAAKQRRKEGQLQGFKEAYSGDNLSLADTILGAVLSTVAQRSIPALGLLGTASDSKGLQLAGDLAVADAVEKAIGET